MTWNRPARRSGVLSVCDAAGESFPLVTLIIMKTTTRTMQKTIVGALGAGSGSIGSGFQPRSGRSPLECGGREMTDKGIFDVC